MRLLLVEDSPRLSELLTERVHEAGWRLDCVGTIAEATEAVRTGLHDLLLVDLGLPDGDGLDFIRGLRRAGTPPRSSPSPRAVRSRTASPASTPAPTTIS